MSHDQLTPSSDGTWEKLSQVAVTGAEYDSRERQPHPKCLNGTRVDLLSYIHKALENREKNQLIWLHGTAGVGKSAVAFTVADRMRGLKVAERTNIEKRLAGTFFFSRKHTDRCTTGYFFATLVYQLASNFPSIRTDVIRTIRENLSLIDPNKSLRGQMEALFLKPLRKLHSRLRGCEPLTFVVDALDKCTSTAELADLITFLALALREPDLPVTHILLTSRPESHICKVFQQDEVRPLVCEIPVHQEPVTQVPQISGGLTSGHSKKESVDWYADQGVVHRLLATIEDDKKAAKGASAMPGIQVSKATADLMDDIDRSTKFRVRSLYPYEGQRPDELSFVENLIITAHPSKTGGDWWYGTIVKDGKSGFFPQTYVQMVEPVKASLVPQPTGFAGHTAAPLAAPPQQHNQARGIGSTPKIPWTLSRAEKKQYDQIYRAWDTQGTGFISGQTALEVFGQSGIDKNDLARIWTLADADNRGKLNLAEFHVAMGLMYRKLNGNDIPDELPFELIPPASRDLDGSVNFLKDIIKKDTRAPSPLDAPASRLKERSSNSTSAPGAGGRQDATVYKHTNAEPPGEFHQPRSRNLDRSTVRSHNENNSPAADMSDIKRQLANTQKMLDASAVADAGDEDLDREMGDLRYRIKRLQDDLDYVSRGPRSASKEEERRRLERELLQLMRERVPELERKIEDRQARKERENREYARERDKRNERSGRFDDTDDRHSASLRYRDEDRDWPYSRSASRYDRDDRDYDRDRSYRDRHDDRDPDRGLSTSTRTPPPPPPPAAPANNILQPPAPALGPSRSPAPGMKNMTPEELQAFIQAQAKKRLEGRMQALGQDRQHSYSGSSLTLV